MTLVKKAPKRLHPQLSPRLLPHESGAAESDRPIRLHAPWPEVTTPTEASVCGQAYGCEVLFSESLAAPRCCRSDKPNRRTRSTAAQTQSLVFHTEFLPKRCCQ